jgi:hypothetical protein
MKDEGHKHTILSLTNDSFKHYLLLNYVSNASNPQWRRLSFISEELISSQTWIQLQNYARVDVESRGGKLTGYEMVGEELVSHEKINSDSWPANWMWVIQRNDLN